ncbi:hypothetical protein ACFUPZ_18525 [Microbacterium oxydans]|uniref:hypothetical protein n=1 Tax=Microbacterium oxydans TaxID=82380 RepID=UPI003628A5D5
MADEQQALTQELDRLIAILRRIEGEAQEVVELARQVQAHATQRKSTEDPSWDEITRIGRTIDAVDNHSGDMDHVRFRMTEMDADMQFILGGV